MILGPGKKLKSKRGSCVVTWNNGTPLYKVDHFKYIRVWLEPELKFKSHKLQNVSIKYVNRRNFDIRFTFILFNRNLLLNSYFRFMTFVILFIKMQLNQISLSLPQHLTLQMSPQFSFITHHCSIYDVFIWPFNGRDKLTNFGFYLNAFISTVSLIYNSIFYPFLQTIKLVIHHIFISHSPKSKKQLAKELLCLKQFTS